jgi:hypothetical protein
VIVGLEEKEKSTVYQVVKVRVRLDELEQLTRGGSLWYLPASYNGCDRAAWERLRVQKTPVLTKTNHPDDYRYQNSSYIVIAV